MGHKWKDFDESKRYWSQVNIEEQKKKSQHCQDSQRKPPHANTRIVQSHNNLVQSDLKTVTIPIILQGRYFKAMLIPAAPCHLSRNLVGSSYAKKSNSSQVKDSRFCLPMDSDKTAIGKVEWGCEIQGQHMELTLFILNDTDLTVPIILGMDFLLTSGIKLDFQKAQHSLPSKEEADEENTFPFLN